MMNLGILEQINLQVLRLLSVIKMSMQGIISTKGKLFVLRSVTPPNNKHYATCRISAAVLFPA